MAAVVVLGLLLAACGPSPNRPEIACAQDLELLTTCVPGEAQRATELFAGVNSEADALTAQQTPLGGALGTRCNTFPDRWTVCITLDNGLTVVTPIASTGDLRMSFTNDGLSTETMAFDEALGIRRESTDLTVNLFDGSDNEWGTIPVGFSPGRLDFTPAEDPS